MPTSAVTAPRVVEHLHQLLRQQREQSHASQGAYHRQHTQQTDQRFYIVIV